MACVHAIRVSIQNKVKLLFEKISEPQYVMNNYYADHFFTKINCSDPEVAFLKTWPLLPDLLIEALNNMEKYHNTVKVFLIRILGVIAQGEVNFSKIFTKKGDDLAKAFSEINSQNMDSSLRVAYMEVALSLIHHNSGVSWLLDSGAWKEILTLCNENRTVFVVRQTYKFATLFLWKLNSPGSVACQIKMVLSFILKPLTENDFLKLNSMTAEEEDIICIGLKPMFQILLAVVSHEEHIKTQNYIIHLLLKDFKILTYCYVLFDRLRREDITLLLVKFLFWMTIGKIFLAKPMAPNVEYTGEDFMELSVTYFNTIQGLIQRRCPTLIFDYCNACNLIWNSIWNTPKPAIWEVDGKKIELQYQLLVICLIPSLVYVLLHKDSACENAKCYEYVTKILNLSSEPTARTAYALRDLMVQLDTQALTLQSVKRLTCLKDHMNNEQANLVFQALFYILKEYDPIEDTGEWKKERTLDDDPEKVLVMTYVLDTVLLLVKNYNINWQDSIEVISLYTVVFNTLKRPNLSCKFVVTALNVITVTVKKFLPPNLSLLLESKPGSSMHEIGQLIYMKMHDFHWEVRDSALELLYVCTGISYIKFPPFQKQIISNNLINVATTMALNDHEFYVRVSALKCLGAASKVSALWDHLTMEYPMIQEQLVSILSSNPEGIVRKEACNVLCEIYQNVKISPAFKGIMYNNMVSSALCDFHWEVQLSALRFWKIVIQSLLNDQGMLDGTFPPVTFSRETRKIVTLNEREIQRRLTKTLQELASIGCLTVLIKLLHDETEVEIMEAALAISTELLEILERYKVPDSITPNEAEPSSADDLLNKIKLDTFKFENGVNVEPENSAKADNVIDSIINADDINLLANIYERHMSLQTIEPEPIMESNHTKLLKFASPYLFISFIRSKDFKQVIEQKRNWNDGIKSFSSLLDDVLGIYEVNNGDDVNSLDCY